LLTRNLHDVFGENDPARRRAAIEDIYTEDCVFYDPTSGAYHGRDEIDRIAGRSRLLTRTFSISRLPSPKSWAMAGGSNGYRAAPASRLLTPGRISSSPGMAGSRPSISFSTGCAELPCDTRATATSCSALPGVRLTLSPAHEIHLSPKGITP
jgi:hypothetical protein